MEVQHRILLCVVFLLSVGSTIQTNPLTRLFQDKFAMYSTFKGMKPNYDGLVKLVKAIKALEISAKTFFDSPQLPKTKNEMASFVSLLKSRDSSESETFGLEEQPGISSGRLKNSNFFRLASFLSDILVKDFAGLPTTVASLCQKVDDDKSIYVGPGLTIKSICNNSVCNIKKTLYPSVCEPCTKDEFKYYGEQSIRPACNELKQCHIERALPLMFGVLWYQLNEMIITRLCPNKCNGPCDYTTEYKTTMQDLKHLIMYIESHPTYWNHVWSPTLLTGVQKMTDLNKLFTFTDSILPKMNYAEQQCSAIRSPAACSVADLKKSYLFLKNFGLNRISVKDVRHYDNTNLAKTIELKKENLKFIKATQRHSMIDTNLEVAFKSLSKYFAGFGKFEEGIARADADFLKGEVTRYETKLTEVQNQLSSDMQTAMNYMMGILGANLAAEIGKMAALIATNSNPLKLLFTGPDLKELAEQAERVADAVSQQVKGATLLKAIDSLSSDAASISLAFRENTGQIDSLQKILNKIVRDKKEDIDADVDKFVFEYGSYKPTKARHLLAKNDALWSAFKDSTCDVINGEVSIGGAVLKSIASSKLICERLDGTLAQFFTLREDIFDFQFQLVDSIASIARANKAQRYAKEIGAKHDSSTIKISDLLIGYFTSQASIQMSCSVLCDVLEYKNLGKPVKPCLIRYRHFTNSEIDTLLAYSANTPYHEIHRSVYLPTRAKGGYEGDTGVIDLQALARGESVLFKVPNNKTWLVEHRWLYSDETDIPFIKELKLFLPHKVNGKVLNRKTDLTIQSLAESRVALNNLDQVYLLPKSHVTFRNIFEEGYHSCPKEIKNPYSLCNNLPKICDKTSRQNTEKSLMPTILSMWKIKATIYEGSKKVKYNPPNPESNLLLKADLILKVPIQSRKKRGAHKEKRSIHSQDRCCYGNKYRAATSKCEECPKGTKSSLGGLYCQI